MEYLSVKQVAELKGCSEQYMQKLCKDGKIDTIQEINSKGRTKYLIPVTALPEDLQVKYYAKLRAEAGLMPELKAEKTAKKQCLKQPQRTFDELGDDEREIVTFWTGVIDEWQRLRGEYTSKAAFDEMYVSKFRLENPDVRISVDILYRKWKAIKEDDIEALLDRRGAWKRRQSSIPEQAWNAFLWYWLDENKPTVSLCYRSMKLWVTDFYPELLEDIPTERAFRRRIDSDVSYALKTYMRDGEKAFHDRCMPYIMRMYDNLAPNDCWIADNHTFDIISNDGNSNHRLYLTAFLDAKSGVLTGWNITDSPDSQSTILALRHGIKRFGIPKCIYVDNGREFLTFDLGGNGNRVRKSTKNAPNPTTIFKRLGIEMRNAINRNLVQSYRPVKAQKLHQGRRLLPRKSIFKFLTNMV